MGTRALTRKMLEVARWVEYLSALSVAGALHTISGASADLADLGSYIADNLETRTCKDLYSTASIHRAH